MFMLALLKIVIKLFGIGIGRYVKVSQADWRTQTKQES